MHATMRFSHTMLLAQEHEVFPAPNPAVLAEIEGADAVVYAMGSLYTSICPSLVLQVGPWFIVKPTVHGIESCIPITWMESTCIVRRPLLRR